MPTQNYQPVITGILLAAGFSRRFGQEDKLLQPLADGQPMALIAARHLIEVTSNAIAVIRPDNIILQDVLSALGFKIALCQSGEHQMADSLKRGIRACLEYYPQTQGYLIGLADMPFIQSQTIQKITTAMSDAMIVQPVFQGKHGHPVGFSKQLTPALLAIEGDQGAREILRNHPTQILQLECNDPGILRDIDTPEDLAVFRLLQD